jgi:hypothetical protein
MPNCFAFLVAIEVFVVGTLKYDETLSARDFSQKR